MFKLMRKYKKAFTVILAIMLLVTVAFIWSNSFSNAAKSAKKSADVTKSVKPVIESVIGDGVVTNSIIRKFAHLTEFFALGCELSLFVIIRNRHGVQPICNCMFAGMFVAAVDETIQAFSDRGSKLTDVWLDLAGVAVAVLLFMAIKSVVHIIRKKRVRSCS